MRLWLVGLLIVLGCTENTSPDSQSNALRKWALPIDSSVTLQVVPNLDGNTVMPTAFNRYDVVAGLNSTAAGVQIFRARNTIDYFTPPAGFQPVTPVGINDGAQVAGGVISDTAFRAFIWWHNGNTTLLNPAIPFDGEEGPLGCLGRAITDSGYVAGSCMPDVNDDIAEWGPNGVLVKESCCGFAAAVSENQYVTGYSTIFDPPQAFLWSPGATTYAFLGATGQEVSGGLAVNQNGWVAGWRELAAGDTAAILWVPGQAENILSHIGMATGVDTLGDVVGYHRESSGSPSIAFLWNAATGAHFLPGLPGGGATAAVAINNVNPQILGWAIDAQGEQHVVIWTFPPN
jgi:uncharacterized membrane protein